jgi:hypothetical protein
MISKNKQETGPELIKYSRAREAKMLTSAASESELTGTAAFTLPKHVRMEDVMKHFTFSLVAVAAMAVLVLLMAPAAGRANA